MGKKCGLLMEVAFGLNVCTIYLGPKQVAALDRCCLKVVSLDRRCLNSGGLYHGFHCSLELGHGATDLISSLN